MSKEYFVAAFTVDRDNKKGYYYEFSPIFYKFKFIRDISLNKINNKILKYVKKQIKQKIINLKLDNFEEYFQNNVEIFINILIEQDFTEIII